MKLLSRGLEPALHHLLDTSKVVILEGGRSVGKTTLAQTVARRRGFQTSFDLSDAADAAALASDAQQVLSASPRPILIDEAQLSADVIVAVKRIVDASSEPGQFLLTGSTRLGRGTLGGGDPLAGRATRLQLAPFTRGELAGAPSNSVARWWATDPDHAPAEALDLAELTRLMVTGGLPPVALADAPTTSNVARSALIDEYIDGVLTIGLAGSRVDQVRLATTFRYLAANPGQILNVSRAASELGARAETVRSHLDLCASAFMLSTVPAVRPAAHRSVTAHPRVFATDLAVAAWAADTSPEQLVRQASLRGSLLENLVAHELRAQSSWGPVPARLMHWRDTKARKEVDLVLRNSSGSFLAFEVKSSSVVTGRDASGLRAFEAAAVGRVERSFVLHTGRLVTQLDERIWAVPITALLGGG